MNRFLNRMTVFILLSAVSMQSACFDKDRAARRKRMKVEKEMHEAFKDGDVAKVEAKLIEAIAIDPSATHLKNSLAILYAFNLKQYDKAKALWEELVQLEPKNAAYINNLAGIYQMTGDMDRAITLYNQAKTLHREYHMPYYNIGKIFISQGKYPEAIAELREGLTKTKRDSILIFTLARALILNGDLTEAESFLRKEIDQGDHSLDTSFLLERLMIRQHRYDEASSVLDALIARYPENLAIIKAEFIQFMLFRNDPAETIQSELEAFMKIPDAQKIIFMEPLVRAALGVLNGTCTENFDALTALDGKIGEEFFNFEAVRQHFLGVCHEKAGNHDEFSKARRLAYELTPELFEKPVDIESMEKTAEPVLTDTHPSASN